MCQFPSYAQHFDALYYAIGCGARYERNVKWLTFFGSIADRIVSDIRPRTVLDAGCAMGFLVEALRERGVEAWGVDISPYAISQVHPSVRDFCRIGSITEPFERRYDLIVCIEVLEHMPPDEGMRAITNLCAHSDDILFSSSPDDFREATHLNVQPPEYWAEHFARHGFIHDLDFDASFITSWAMRFTRCNWPTHRVVHEYERRMARFREENRQLRDALQAVRNRSDVAQLVAERDALQQALQQAHTERDSLQQLVRGYEQGRFMRFMRWLKRVKTKILQLVVEAT